MDALLLYQQEPQRLEFEAVVQQQLRLPDGRLGLILEQSYFYPTGGGQEADRGSIGQAQVVDVFKQDDPPALVHIVDQPVPPGKYPAHIDAVRRLRAMQHHTAQHLLSQCFLRLFNLETQSANINVDSPSTVDFPYTVLSPADLQRAEDLANQVIYENRQVKAYFISPEALSQVPLRRPPKVSENIRIIEIDGYEYSACGGTHVSQTGAIGVIKILRTERQNEKTRVHFIAGMQALETFQDYHAALGGMAVQLNVSIPELPQVVLRQAEQLKGAQKELQTLRLERLTWEARSLAEEAAWHGSRRLVIQSFAARPVSELRSLAEHLKGLPGMAAVLAGVDGQKLSLVAACAPDSGLDARTLLQALLAEIGGRGGGDAQLAQGGGAASSEQLQALLEHARRLMQPAG